VRPAAASESHRPAGVALCLLSAVGFGLMAIFAKEAYAAGLGVTSLLAARFVLAACVFWAIVALRGRLRSRPDRSPRPPRHVVIACLGLGAIGYSAQAGLFFSALEHIDASLTSLLLYTYPALVFGVALLLGRERGGVRRLGALVLSSAGTALVLLGGASGTADPLGIAMGLASALAYTGYILVADRIADRIDPLLLSALVAAGAALSLVTVGGATGRLDLGFDAAGWPWIVAIAGISTVVAVSFFLLGLARVGPAAAGILSTLEPVVTVALAMLVYGERLSPVQTAGGMAVIAAIVLLQANVRPRDAPAQAPAAPAARAVARQPAGG
jgi:drug/metabolite transporter (DMT)-like permease